MSDSVSHESVDRLSIGEVVGALLRCGWQELVTPTQMARYLASAVELTFHDGEGGGVDG